ncbi:MAG: GSCFA domain-containing protein [Bacteroidales bacterium]|nr:GSCFA domain-containing protein [Bacteroidales bacterium]
MSDRFRTIINIPDPPFSVSYDSKCLFTGSCFTETIGERMVRFKYPVVCNPFGILYNPSSIGKCLRMLMSDRLYTEGDLYFHNGLWISLDHHSSFSNTDRQICLSGINKSLVDSRKFLKRCRFLFITFGTAWLYIFRETGQIVSNCHKIPAAQFERKLLEPGEIISDYHALIRELYHYNPDLQMIFTVSPIRHMKDGAFSNQVSKSTLILAIYKLQNLIGNIHYFPAYEIFMDELRDYRFYADDMLHPSGLGIAYVWDRFCETYMDKPSRVIMAAVEKIRKALAHRPLQTGSQDYLTFIDQTRRQIEQLQKACSFLDFSDEIKKLDDIVKNRE